MTTDAAARDGLTGDPEGSLPSGARAGLLPGPVRFAVGTLTRVPVPAPRALDARVAGRGLALGPLVGAAIGVASALPMLAHPVDPLQRCLAAILAVALAAWATRALHWDGLADTADGLGSARPAAGALVVMRASDIGPFGTLTMILTVLVQVLALACLPANQAIGTWVLAQGLARVALGLACGPWVRPARPDGLGALVIGAVRGAGLVVLVGLGLAVSLVAAQLTDLPVLAVPIGLAGAVATSVAMARVAARRFGGSTGDVLGATVELAATAVLLAAVMASSLTVR